MNIEKIQEDHGHVTYDITVPKETFLEDWNKNIKKLSSTAKIPGFRPGHVPSDVIERKVKDPLLKDMLDEYVKKALGDLKKDQISPIGNPHITEKVWSLESKVKDSVFTLDFDVFPIFNDMDFSTIDIRKPEHKATDQDIDDAVQSLLKSKKIPKSTTEDRPVATGDQIIFDFLGKVDGEPFEGGKAEDYKLEIGSNSFIPGFEEKLIGKKMNTPFTITVPFPDDYPVEDLKGKSADFDITIKSIHEFELPTLDDTFATGFGAKDTEDLRQRIKNDLQYDYEHMSFEVMKIQIMKRLLQEYEHISLPKKVVEKELKTLPEDDQKDAKKQENLRKRLLLSLVIADFGNKKSIDITENDYKQALMAEASKYKGSEKQVIEYYQKHPQQAEQLIMPIFEDKVFKEILDISTTNTESVSREDLNKEYDNTKDEIKRL